MGNPNPNPSTRFTSENQPDAEKKSRKGSPNISTIIRQILDLELTDKDGNKVTNNYLMNKAIVEKAKTGDVPAFKALAERLEGMPKQEIDQNIKTQEPIQINFSLFNSSSSNELKDIDDNPPLEENNNQSEMDLDNEESRVRESIQEDTD